jgi:hypothetical protein
LVYGSVKYVIALVHGISQHAQLLQHTLVCDVASRGFIDDGLCPKENPLQAVLNMIIWHLLLGAFADEEIYGSRDHFTKEHRKKSFHYGLNSQEDNPNQLEKTNQI